MKRPSPVDYEAHNQYQQDYFSAVEKKTMLPRATPYLERHVDAMLQHVKLSQAKRVLEVGCGMGRYTLLLAQRGVPIEGLDLTPGLLEKLREFNRGQPPIPLHCCDIAAPSAELVGEFDAVLGFFCLHHVHDVPACYRAMASLLKPGGSIAFLEPNPFNLLYYIQILFSPKMSWRAERGMLDMRKSYIFKAMQEAGLQGLQLRRFGFFPPFIANLPMAAKLEAFLEKLPFLNPLLPFQIFIGHKR